MAKSEIKFDEHGSWIWKDDNAREPNLILFIHGYTGHPEATWAKFPELIRRVGQGFDRGFEVASFGYKSKLIFNFRSRIATISQRLLTFIDAHAHENKNIFIVAHSLGGLVARRFLVETFNQSNQREFFQKVQQLHFIGVPHMGAAIAPRALKWLKMLNHLAAELRRNSPTLIETLKQWDNVAKNCGHATPAIFNYVGDEDWLAPMKQVISEFNAKENVRTVDGNHVSIAKPHDTENEVYKLVKRHILEAAWIPSESVGKQNRNDNVSAPPLNALHQLEPPPADFTGRTAELNELLPKLETGGVTISGLQGMGGIGKTALALKLAERLVPRYPDAQFFLDLKGVSDKPLSPAEAMAHVIRAYHPTAKLPESETELKPLYQSVLHGQRALLLMDNARDGQQVLPLLPPATCLLLVTSRQHFTLPGLYAKDLNTLTPKEAGELLLAIAPRIGAAAEAMAKLCDYLPHALRLAASALAEQIDLSPADYLTRLENTQTRLDLVEASLSLSYDLLHAETQKWWRLLSVFPDTFDQPAGAAVWEMDIEPAQKNFELAP